MNKGVSLWNELISSGKEELKVTEIEIEPESQFWNVS